MVFDYKSNYFIVFLLFIVIHMYESRIDSFFTELFCSIVGLIGFNIIFNN